MAPTATAEEANAILITHKTIVLGGKKWTARKIHLGDLTDFESHLRAVNVENFLIMAEKVNMNDDLISATLDRLYNAPWSPEQKASHSNSMGGIQYLLYRAIRDAHPEMTIEKVGALVGHDELPAAMEALEAIQRNTTLEAVEAGVANPT